jgi:hypothetical protein
MLCIPLPAGQTAAPCNPGTTACKNGMIVCQGEVLPVPNTCMGPATDCTGNPNTNGNCAAGLTCYMGTLCAETCKASEFPCPAGYLCDPPTNLCVPDKCAALNCQPGFFCNKDASGNVSCVDQCTRVSCPTGFVCSLGVCHDMTCNALGCPTGQICTGSPPTCTPDPCAGVTCPAGQYCDRSGKCVSPCSACPHGQICIGGACMNDPCATRHCMEGEVCAVMAGMGVCVANQCSAGCNPGTVCCNGMCLNDPCANFGCPSDSLCAVDDTCNPTCKAKTLDKVVATGSGGAGCAEGGGWAAARRRRRRRSSCCCRSWSCVGGVFEKARSPSRSRSSPPGATRTRSA